MEKLRCDHDWRVDPRWQYSSMPPREALTCADCGAHKPGGVSAHRPPNDPKQWDKPSEEYR